MFPTQIYQLITNRSIFFRFWKRFFLFFTFTNLFFFSCKFVSISYTLRTLILKPFTLGFFKLSILKAKWIHVHCIITNSMKKNKHIPENVTGFLYIIHKKKNLVNRGFFLLSGKKLFFNFPFVF